MKRLRMLITFFVILFGLTACLSQKDNEYVQSQHKAKAGEDVREKVWNQLEKAKKDKIKGTWSDGTVRKITLTDHMGKIVDKAFIGEVVYLVDFTTKKSGIPNNMVIYADKESGKIVGYGYVD